MKIILVDDEHLALKYMERQLKKLDTVEVDIVGMYTDPHEAVLEIEIKRPEVVFLDIGLIDMNGIELAEQLLEKNPRLNIVFVTAYMQYAVDAFELNAVDYLVKPVRPERLAKTLERIGSRIGTDLEERRPDSLARQIHMKLLRQVMIENPLEQGQFSLIHWRTSKAQELFLYLLQYRGQLVRKLTLLDLLWPDIDTNKAYSQLYTTIYHIRKTLEPYDGRFKIVSTSEGYILQHEGILLDIEEWENKLEALPNLSDESVPQYFAWMKDYSGAYLQEYDYWWAESERRRFKNLYIGVCYSAAEWCMEHDRVSEAVTIFQRVIRENPLEERAYFSLMKCHALQGNPLLVTRQYEMLIDIFAQELNIKPSTEIEKWYDQWRSTTSNNR